MEIAKFFEVLGEVFEKDVSSISESDIFRNYEEWDSITLLTLMSSLEDEYGVTIPRAKFESIQTTRELFNYVNENS
jgi:acyl carrier protein